MSWIQMGLNIVSNHQSQALDKQKMEMNRGKSRFVATLIEGFPGNLKAKKRVNAFDESDFLGKYYSEQR